MYSALRPTTPSSVILPVTVDQVKRHARIDHDSEDDLLLVYIQAAIGRVEQYTARTLIQRQYDWYTADSPPANTWPFVGIPPQLIVLPLAFDFAFWWGRPKELPRSPVVSVDLVETFDWQGNVLAVTPDQYNINAQVDPARLMFNQGVSSPSRLHVRFTAGYGQTVDAVPPELALAIMWLVTFMYEHRGDEPDVETLPSSVRALLAPYRVMTFA